MALYRATNTQEVMAGVWVALWTQHTEESGWESGQSQGPPGAWSPQE